MKRDGGLLGLLPNCPASTCRCPSPASTAASLRDGNAAEAFLFAYSGIVFWAIALAGVWVVLLRRHHAATPAPATGTWPAA